MVREFMKYFPLNFQKAFFNGLQRCINSCGLCFVSCVGAEKKMDCWKSVAGLIIATT
jgi:hypothetical protein